MAFNLPPFCYSELKSEVEVGPPRTDLRSRGVKAQPSGCAFCFSGTRNKNLGAPSFRTVLSCERVGKPKPRPDVMLSDRSVPRGMERESKHLWFFNLFTFSSLQSSLLFSKFYNSAPLFSRFYDF